MPTYALSATAWQRVALGGSTVKLQASSYRNPVLIMTGLTAPSPSDFGIVLTQDKSGETISFTQDLWARASSNNNEPCSISVLDGLKSGFPSNTQFVPLLINASSNGPSSSALSLDASVPGLYLWSAGGIFAGATVTLQQSSDGVNYTNMTALDGTPYAFTSTSSVVIPLSNTLSYRAYLSGATGTTSVSSALRGLY